MEKRFNQKSIPPKPADIQTMFNAIAPTYDLLNHLLSFRLDIRWRRKAVRLIAEKRGGTILDIATGSGDFSLEVLKLQPRHIVAIDFAQKMLKVFQQKLKGYNDADLINLVSCDALCLPFRGETFDATLVAFGIRNFTDRFAALQELLRVLKPNGSSVILELSKPKAPIISQLYTLYSHIGLPLLGKIISRHNSAYRYLTESIVAFPQEQEFLALMKDAGFANVSAHSLTFGAATIYVGTRGKGEGDRSQVIGHNLSS